MLRCIGRRDSTVLLAVVPVRTAIDEIADQTEQCEGNDHHDADDEG